MRADIFVIKINWCRKDKAKQLAGNEGEGMLRWKLGVWNVMKLQRGEGEVPRKMVCHLA
jgi:hypothetical protein